MGREEIMAKRQAIRRQRAADAAAAAAAARTGPDARVAIVTTMKNEGPFILEWVAHHRAIGINDFLVYTNDCDDGTDHLLDVLVSKGFVSRHLENPFVRNRGSQPQRAALRDAQTNPVITAADWVIPMDVDEFINIHIGDGRFQTLLDAVPDANMISMTWRLFGNGFVRDYEDRLITEQMLYCAHERARKPHQAWGFKTAFRDLGIFRRYSVHRPKGLRPKRVGDIRWVCANGRPMPDSYYMNGWRASVQNWGYGLVTLNHYSLRSSQSYLVKKERGRVNHVDRDQGLAYWFRMNHNAEEDRSIQARLPGTRAEYANMMANAEIRAAHLACVEAHQRKIADLMAQPDYAALFELIETPRMKALSRMLANFDNAIFNVGPDAVPASFIERADAMADRLP
ncbi:MAG: glycosyltransferase family 2 protein [Pseudomonadota bacterium]